MRTGILIAILLGLGPAHPTAAEPLAQPLSATRIIDLTHSLHEGMPYWPGGVPFRMERLVDYDQGYRLHKFSMGENTGTHVDAPSHFIPGKRDIDDIPPADLVVPLVVIDVSAGAAGNADYRLSRRDVLDWEARHGRVPAHSLVVMNSGWHRRYVSPEDYINMDGDKVMHFPGFSRPAAALLLERDVAGIGVDTLSIDYGASTDYAVHGLMLEHNKYQIENLANLDAVPPAGASAIIGVLPVKDGTQAQARIFALLP
jgi:kynurenine formamidase